MLLKKDVALIIILCPPSLHSQIAVKALGIGKHVVCGLPGGLDQPECLRMVQVCQSFDDYGDHDVDWVGVLISLNAFVWFRFANI